MKYCTKIGILIFTLGVVCLFSCQNEPSDIIENQEKAYSDTTAAHVAVEKLYTKGLPQLYLSADQENGIPLAWGSYLSGLFESEATQGYYPALVKQDMTDPSVRNLARQIYTACFDGIEAADSVILQIPNTKGFTPAEQAKLVGEAKFFRAFNRFYLIRTFGSFPDKQHEKSWLNLEKAYLKVEKDLLDAIATLPEKNFQENNSHVTAFSARALLGDVYLHMSGKPLQKNKYEQAAAILRPVIQSEKHHIATNGANEEMSAINTLRTTPTNDEYLYVVYGETSLTRASFAFPKMARNWDNVKEHVAFNAFKPIQAFMSCYAEGDIRGKDQQYFHTFFKVKDEGKTIFEIFAPAPYFWLTSGTGIAASNKQYFGIYRYAEVLLMAAEAIAYSEGVTPEAVNYLFQVRARSTSDLQIELSKKLSVLPVNKFVEEVWLERLRELPYEMKHLSDILRTDHYPVYKDSTLQFVPLQEAVTPQGNLLNKPSFFLPKPTL